MSGVDELANTVRVAFAPWGFFGQEPEIRLMSEDALTALVALCRDTERDRDELRDELAGWMAIQMEVRVARSLYERADAAEARLAQATEALEEIHSKPYRAEEVTLRYFAAAGSDATEAKT